MAHLASSEFQALDIAGRFGAAPWPGLSPKKTGPPSEFEGVIRPP